MTQILQLKSSLFRAEGQSSLLSDAFVSQYAALNSDVEVTVRKLAPSTMPHLDEETFGAFTTPVQERTDRQLELAALSDELIDELECADLIVIGLPMYNLNIPSTLKAWFDHVARAGVTFRYTENGPEGLLQGKRAVICCARGGSYSGNQDHQTPYVRQFLGFLGIDDVEFVYSEGLASGDAEKSLADARRNLERLATTIARPQLDQLCIGQ